MTRERLTQMFSEVLIKKDASLIPVYYHPGFVRETNGRKQSYAAFLARHERAFATDIVYHVHYDDSAWVESTDRVGARLWITSRRSGKDPEVTEFMLIASWLGGRIHRLWELTWPDRSRMPASNDSLFERLLGMRTMITPSVETRPKSSRKNSR